MSAFAAVLAAFLALIAGPAPRPAAEGPEPLRRFVLDNGLTVLTLKDASSALTELEILFRGGQTAEPADKAGLSYLTTRLAVDIPDQDKVQEFMTKALHYSVSAKADYSAVHLECLSEYFDEAVSNLAEILADPLFTGIRIDRLKQYMEDQRRLTADVMDNAGHALHLGAFYGESPYGRAVYGTEASLQAIRASDIKDFYGRLFVPRNMVLVAVSDLDPEALAAVLKKRFGGFRKGAPEPPPPAPLPPAAKVFTGLKDTGKDSLRTLVSAAFALPALTPRTFVLNALVENTLGRGPGTRLWRLRSELRLAYDVAARATSMRWGGLLESSLETDPAKAEEARVALDQALAEFVGRGIDAEELEAARAEVKAQFLRGNERKDARTATLATLEMLGLGAEFFEAFPAELGRVDLEAVNAYIRSVLDPGRASWIRIGPKR